MMAINEQRRYPRLELNIEDGFFGNFLLPDKKSIVASLVNLSAGGVNFAIPADKQAQIHEGDVLLLQHIAGATRLSFLEDIRSEIRWIKSSEDAKALTHVGCAFLDLTDTAIKQLTRFVDSERVARGQYL
jgi:c-di-GMP-binding flagellar brake protein YcgR